jgi:hypothetical protein
VCQADRTSSRRLVDCIRLRTSTDSPPVARVIAAASRAARTSRGTMPAGPFASSVGVGRAEPEWAALNKVTGVCGEGTRAPPVLRRASSERARPHLVFLFWARGERSDAPRVFR